MTVGLKRIRDCVWLCGLAVYLALIFYVSSRPNLQPPVRFPLWDKAAHFGEYAILGLLARMAVARIPRLRRRGTAVVLAFGLAVGALDELLQLHVPGRQASLADLGMDLLGVTAGLVLARLPVFGPPGERDEHG